MQSELTINGFNLTRVRLKLVCLFLAVFDDIGFNLTRVRLKLSPA